MDPTLEDQAPSTPTGYHLLIRAVHWAAWIAIIARVITVLAMSRGWFFTNDDWDYATRKDLGSVLEPHQGHINAINAASVLVLRGIVGLDFWPGYGLIVALAWPALALVAWWAWRKRGVQPLIASTGAIFIAWLGSAAYMQFSHVNPAWALIATLVALEYDDKGFSPKNTGIGTVVSLIAVFANTLGAIAAGARLLVAAGRRQWNGVATAGGALVVYAIVRSIVTQSLDSAFSFGDLFRAFRVALGLIGHGLHKVIPMPGGFEPLAALGLIAIAISIVIFSRFSHHASALILTGMLWLASAVVVGYLNVWGPERFDALAHGFPNDNVIWPRFANIIMITVLLAGIPVLSSRMRSPGLRQAGVGLALVVALLSFNVVQSVRVFDQIGDKSVPLAEVAGGLAIAEAQEGPSLRDFSRISPGTRIGRANLQRLMATEEGIYAIASSRRSPLDTSRWQVTWMVDRDLVDSLIRSDVFREAGAIPDAEWGRAMTRFSFSGGSEPEGSWADLDVTPTEMDECRPFEVLEPMEVLRTTTFVVTYSWPDTGTDDDAALISVELEDDFGVAKAGLLFARPGNKPQSVSVTVLGPESGIGTPVLSVTGTPGASLCHAIGTVES